MAPGSNNNKRDDGDDDDIVINDDPDGTIQIARGMSDKDARKRRYEKLNGGSDGDDNANKKVVSKEERDRIKQYMNGPNGEYSNEKRRQQIINDDKEMSFSKLTSNQEYSLKKRQKGFVSSKGNRRKDKIVNTQLERHETKRLESAVASSDAQLILHTETPGLVEAEHDMERTTSLSQNELKRKYLNEQSAKNIYDLNLTTYNPYGMKYDRSGRCAIIYGQKGGHIALMDCYQRTLETEFYLNSQHYQTGSGTQEVVRDVTFLHNTSLFGVAQKNHVYIYDKSGVEIHRLQDHQDPFQLQFLPYHYLLVSIGRAGWLKYHDTSTGELISQHRTKLGACNIMKQNKSNAIIHCGHTNGTVTLWSPASSQYLVKMLCHKGSPITSMTISQDGQYMITGGSDKQVKIWDLRMYKHATHSYYTPNGIPNCLDISQRNILGVGHSCQTTFWKPQALKVKCKDPYMSHTMPGCGPIETIQFRPYEDVVGIGHQKGISSIVIPGCGEPNLDTNEYNTNPYQDNKQQRESEVRSLLDKLSPNMISIDPDIIGGIELSDPHRRLEHIRDLEEEANSNPKDKKKKSSKKRGRSAIQVKLRRKHKNIIDDNVMKLRDAKEKQKQEQQEIQQLEQQQQKKKKNKKKKKGSGSDGDNNDEIIPLPSPSTKETTTTTTTTNNAPAALKRFF